MEMQLFILGHVILLAFCLAMTIATFKADALLEFVKPNAKVEPKTAFEEDRKLIEMYLMWFGLFALFEIIYWLLHWMIVGF